MIYDALKVNEYPTKGDYFDIEMFAFFLGGVGGGGGYS